MIWKSGALQMKIAAVEVADDGEAGPIENFYRSARAHDELFLRQRLQRPVHVNCGEAESIGQFLLRHRQLIALRGSETRLVEPDRELAEHMRHAGQRVARSEEHTSELQSLMRISYAVCCVK